MLLPQAKRNIDRAGLIGCDAPSKDALQKKYPDRKSGPASFPIMIQSVSASGFRSNT